MKGRAERTFTHTHTHTHTNTSYVLRGLDRVHGVVQPFVINAIADLAATYQYLGKYKEAEKLQIQVLDARKRIIGVEHPDTINAMEQLAATYQNLGKYTEAEELAVQAQETRNIFPEAESLHMNLRDQGMK